MVKKNTIIIDYDGQPMILLDLIPKDSKKLIYKIKESRKNGLEKWVDMLINPSNIWKEIDDILTHISNLLNDD